MFVLHPQTSPSSDTRDRGSQQWAATKARFARRLAGPGPCAATPLHGRSPASGRTGPRARCKPAGPACRCCLPVDTSDVNFSASELGTKCRTTLPQSRSRPQRWALGEHGRHEWSMAGRAPGGTSAPQAGGYSCVGTPGPCPEWADAGPGRAGLPCGMLREPGRSRLAQRKHARRRSTQVRAVARAAWLYRRTGGRRRTVLLRSSNSPPPARRCRCLGSPSPTWMRGTPGVTKERLVWLADAMRLALRTCMCTHVGCAVSAWLWPG